MRRRHGLPRRPPTTRVRRQVNALGSAVLVLSLTAGVVPSASGVATGPTPVRITQVPDAALLMKARVMRAVRIERAQESRLSAQVAAFAAVRRGDAEAMARAAVLAARTAAGVAETAAPETREALMQSAAALDELAATPSAARAAQARRLAATTAERAAAPRGDWQTEAGSGTVGGYDRARATVEDLQVAARLEQGTREVYAVAFQLEAAATSAVAVLPTFDDAGLVELGTTLEALPALPTDLVMLPEIPTVAELRELGRLGELPRLGPRPGSASADRTQTLRGRFSSRVAAAAWDNGAFPLEELCAPESAPGALLHCEAAEALDRMQEAYLEEHGVPFDVVSSYRSFETQVEVKRLRGGLAAAPGTSNHGLGVAIDVADAGGLGQFDAPLYLWLKENAVDFGWQHPPEMEPGGSGPQEPWHWEYWG